MLSSASETICEGPSRPNFSAERAAARSSDDLWAGIERRRLGVSTPRVRVINRPNQVLDIKEL